MAAPKRKPLSARRVRELFDVDASGRLMWRQPTSNRIRRGDPAGSLGPDGVLRVSIDGSRYPVADVLALYGQPQVSAALPQPIEAPAPRGRPLKGTNVVRIIPSTPQPPAAAPPQPVPPPRRRPAAANIIVGLAWAVFGFIFLALNSVILSVGASHNSEHPAVAAALAIIAATVPWVVALVTLSFGMTFFRWRGLVLPAHGTIILAIFWAGLVSFNVIGGLGSIAANRSAVVATREHDAETIRAWRDQRAALASQRDATPAARPADAVQREIEAQRQSRLWELSGQCRDATARRERDYCAHLERLAAEIANSRQRERLNAQISDLDSRLASHGPVARTADPQVALLKRLTGWTEDSVVLAVSVILPLIMEFGGAFSWAFAFRAWGINLHEMLEGGGGSSRPTKAGGGERAPLRLDSPENVRGARVYSIRELKTQTDTAEWFFREHHARAPGGSLPEAQWYERYEEVCRKLGAPPLNEERFRRIAARYVPTITTDDGVTYYAGILPVDPTPEALEQRKREARE